MRRLASRPCPVVTDSCSAIVFSYVVRWLDHISRMVAVYELECQRWSGLGAFGRRHSVTRATLGDRLAHHRSTLPRLRLPVEWTPVRRVSLAEEVADQLISAIVTGQFALGDRLPPERELAALFQVARPTLREAMRTLSVIGFVEVRSGEGTFVAERHADYVAKAFSWSVLFDVQTAREVVQTRVAIETELARLAAEPGLGG